MLDMWDNSILQGDNRMSMEKVFWIMLVSLEVGMYTGIVWIPHNCHSQVSEVVHYG